MKNLVSARLFIFLTTVTAAACGDATDLATEDEPQLAEPYQAATAPNPTFKNVRERVFTSCGGFPACHRRGPFAGALNLTDELAYSNLVGVAADAAPDKMRVVPGDPTSSFLYQKLINTQGPEEGLAMPKSEGGVWKKLTSTQLSLVKRWIAAGAPNN